MNTKIKQPWWLKFFIATALLAFSQGVLVADAPAPEKKQIRYEIKFLTSMIDHHAMAVMMADMCMERVVHEQLEQLCEEIKTAQMEEIATMQSWLMDWYGISYEPQMKRGDHKQMEKLAELSGEQFEVEFMEMMIRHHEKAIREGVHCINSAYHPELIQLCENMVETQSKEIAIMETWLCQWYSICRK